MSRYALGKMADSVVIRSRRNSNHLAKFDVDGEDFPWWISEREPVVTQLADDLFSVHVEIIAVPRVYDNPENKTLAACHVGDGDLSVRTEGYMGRRLFIGGVEFPWMITYDGFTIKTGGTTCQTVELSFFAKTVDSDDYIRDTRWVQNINTDNVAMPENSEAYGVKRLAKHRGGEYVEPYHGQAQGSA